MIPQVNSLEEARDWFLENSSGNVMCVKGAEQRECNCYPDAKAFYESGNPQPADAQE